MDDLGGVCSVDRWAVFDKIVNGKWMTENGWIKSRDEDFSLSVFHVCFLIR